MSELAAATAELMSDDRSGPSVVWCMPGFASQWVSREIARFVDEFPQYGIKLRPTDRIAALDMRQADVDIRFYGDHWLPKPGGNGLRYVEIARPVTRAVARPDVAARLSALGSVALLAHEVTLLHTDSLEEWSSWLRLNGIETSGELPGRMLWHANLAIAAACEGRGVALGNDYLVGRACAGRPRRGDPA